MTAPQVPEKSKRKGRSGFQVILVVWIGVALLVFLGSYTVDQFRKSATPDIESTIQNDLAQKHKIKAQRVHLFHDQGSHYTGYAETDRGLIRLDVEADSRGTRFTMPQ